MTSRPAAHVVRRFPAPPGEHPNRYMPWITCDLRVFWTPQSEQLEVVRAVLLSTIDIYDLIERRHAQGELAERGQR